MAGKKLRYVRDYTPSEQPGVPDRKQTGYTYTGKTFVPAGKDTTGAVRTGLFLTIAGWTAYLAALLLNSRAMHTAWISLPFVFCGLCLWIVSRNILVLLRKRTVFRQKEADGINNAFPPAALFLAVLAFLSLAADLIRLAVGGRGGSGTGENLIPGDYLFPVFAAVLFAAGAGLFRMRVRIRLKEAEGNEV